VEGQPRGFGLPGDGRRSGRTGARTATGLMAVDASKPGVYAQLLKVAPLTVDGGSGGVVLCRVCDLRGSPLTLPRGKGLFYRVPQPFPSVGLGPSVCLRLAPQTLTGGLPRAPRSPAHGLHCPKSRDRDRFTLLRSTSWPKQSFVGVNCFTLQRPERSRLSYPGQLFALASQQYFASL
jgi:hypothetical protein